jgi:hypothetical protein
MLKHVRWRVVLPVLNLMLFVTLTVWDTRPRLLTAVFQENTSAPWTVEDLLYVNPLYPLLPLPRQIAVAVNAPACVAATLILKAAGISNQRFASVLLPLMSPFIVLLWYVTGRWVDHRSGNLPKNVPPRGHLHILTTAAVLAGLVLGVCSYRAVYFVNGGIAGWHGETRVNAAITYGLTGWLVLWEIMLVTSAVRCGKQRAS